MLRCSMAGEESEEEGEEEGEDEDEGEDEEDQDEEGGEEGGAASEEVAATIDEVIALHEDARVGLSEVLAQQGAEINGAGDVAPVAPPEQRVGKGKGKAVAAPINEHVAGDESD